MAFSQKLISCSKQLTSCSAWKIQFAAHVIRQGGVIAHPTESIWGLACDPFNPQAVTKLLTIKQRASDKGLILVSGQARHFQTIIKALPLDLSERFHRHTEVPTTWLVPDIENQVPDYIKGSFSSVALRLSSNDVIFELSRRLDHAIISSSANPAGLKPAKTILKIQQYFGSALDYVLLAPAGQFSRPSEIRDLETNRVVRA